METRTGYGLLSFEGPVPCSMECAWRMQTFNRSEGLTQRAACISLMFVGVVRNGYLSQAKHRYKRDVAGTRRKPTNFAAFVAAVSNAQAERSMEYGSSNVRSQNVPTTTDGDRLHQGGLEPAGSQSHAKHGLSRCTS